MQCTNRPVSSAHISYIQCNLLSTALGFSHHSCVMSYFYVTILFSLLLSAEREMTTGLPVRGTVAMFCGREGNRRSGDATAPCPVLTTRSTEDRGWVGLRTTRCWLSPDLFQQLEGRTSARHCRAVAAAWLIYASTYRPLSAFKASAITDILKHDTLFVVCLLPFVNSELFVQKWWKLVFRFAAVGLVLVLAVAAADRPIV